MAAAELERQQEELAFSSPNRTGLITPEIVMNCSSLEDCKAIISELLGQVKKQDDEIFILRERQTQIEDYFRHEFSKIIPEAEKEKTKRNEDTWLCNKWKVSNKALYFAANDHGTMGAKKLFDKVFTQKLLRKYPSEKKLPNRLDFKLRDAYSDLLGMLIQSEYIN